MTTMIEMQQHPRWIIYRKVRRAVARELAAQKAALARNPRVTEGDVDDYLRIHMKAIQRDVRRFFRFDSGVRETPAMADARSRAAEIEGA